MASTGETAQTLQLPASHPVLFQLTTEEWDQKPEWGGWGGGGIQTVPYTERQYQVKVH